MDPPVEPSPKRRRASRAGQIKRFECQHSGCGKRYSRAEHLHRHELNHNPKEIYTCELPDCGQTFVRQDLFARHKARHESTTEHPLRAQHAARQQPVSPEDHSTPPGNPAPLGVQLQQQNLPIAETDNLDQQQSSHFEASAWPSESSQAPFPSSAVVPLVPVVESAPIVHAAPTPLLNQWTAVDGQAQINDSFAAWLFASPGSQNTEFDLTNLPFVDFGLEYSPQDLWQLDHQPSPGQPLGDGELQAQLPENLPLIDDSHRFGASITEDRRNEIIEIIAAYLKKHPAAKLHEPDHLLYDDASHQLPNLTSTVLDRIEANYWVASKQIPIVHQPTFCSNTCSSMLLLAMIAFGATDMVRAQPKGALTDHNELGDLIIHNLRWEVFTHDDAHPPIKLWVAQTLLIIEYYEKHCSSRKLHERGHIHHSSTLTLLRRGSPLVGSLESDGPSAVPTRQPSPTPDTDRAQSAQHRSSIDAWWLQWVRNESFNRVVFAAFQMDTLHAVMFGHAADMAPYEIRLALPCDESLWAATSAEEIHRLDANLKMYGVRPVQFLDGLKRCLHAHDVQTHAPARVLLMAGLLSVGWHISRREKHLQFLDTVPSVREQGRWRALLLNAFGQWRSCFVEAGGGRKNNLNALDMHSSSPGVLFHLAHMTMHADIIDCQIFSGSKRLLGRKVTDKDYVNVVQRMQSWVCTPLAQHATLHAFKLLHETLLSPNILRSSQTSRLGSTSIKYNCRTDPLFYRPWALFLAGLIMWAYQHASGIHPAIAAREQRQVAGIDDDAICCRYLSICATIEDPAHIIPSLSSHGCAAVLAVLSRNFANAEPEILEEASKRLQECRDMLTSNTISWPMPSRT